MAVMKEHEDQPLARTSDGTLHVEEQDGELVVRVTGAAVERVLLAQRRMGEVMGWLVDAESVSRS